MITRIGIVAGEIWHYLDEHGPSTLSNMSAKIEETRDMILMSLGWLAREGHVVVNDEKDYLVTLRKKSRGRQAIKTKYQKSNIKITN